MPASEPEKPPLCGNKLVGMCLLQEAAHVTFVHVIDYEVSGCGRVCCLLKKNFTIIETREKSISRKAFNESP